MMSALNTLAAIRPRRKVPTIFQMEAVECGAAALAMILAYYGKHVPLEELRVACGVSRDGSKALNLLRAARTYGLVAKGVKREPADFLAMAEPVILFWRFNHFVVLERYDRRGALLVDPALGRRRVTREEFDRSFTGVVLQFGPGPEFAKSGRAPNLRASLARRTKGAGSAIAYVLLVAIALTFPGVIVPALSTLFIDAILVDNQHDWLGGIVGGSLAALAVSAALLALQRLMLLRLETNLAVISSAKLLWQALQLPLAFFHQRSAADIAGRIVLNNRVSRIIATEIVGGAGALVTALLYGAVMLGYDAPMALTTMALSAVSLIVVQAVSRQRDELGTRLSIEHGKLNNTAVSGIAIMESVKATGTEPELFGKVMGNHAHYQNAFQEFGRLSAILEVVPKFFAALGIAALFGLGGLRVMKGEMTFGTLVAFQALAAAYLVPVGALVALSGRISAVRGDFVRLEDIETSAERYRSSQPERAPPIDCAKLEGYLEFRDIAFGYSRLEPALVTAFNLKLEPGTRVALVGSSGCGKSTIAKLALGQYALWGGDILFDGKPAREWPRLELQNTITSIDQDIALFSGTVRDNLTLWDETIEEEHLVDAAKDACIHDVIMERPGGYDSLVSEGGSNFSGGQRQRLEIARALVQRPRVLIMDEGTSALDPVTEETVMANIRRRGCACLIVAHRLSAVRDCDRIVVLDKGAIVEQGTHEALMARAGRYAALISAE
jgi:NHLM bacteriocin system ABC transporter peptidase/ATP-binding protein